MSTVAKSWSVVIGGIPAGLASITAGLRPALRESRDRTLA
jgi:hypothetical protein